MRSQLRPALVTLLFFSLLTGLLYPMAVTGLAQLFFPAQANGSIIMHNGKALGSKLIGQSFDDSRYFWSRLSATGTFPYNAFNAKTLTASSGSNYGPLNKALLDAVQSRVDMLKAADPGNTEPIPVDLVTASGSGLDPHISVAAALYQVARVARARGMDEAKVRELVLQKVEPRQFGVLGEPRINVLKLNLALDEIQ